MKALTLTEPWAMLVAVGAKQIETRSWKTSYRGPLAIHAALGLAPIGGKRGLWNLLEQQPFNHVLRQHLPGYTIAEMEEALPRGVIVAVCELEDCRRIEADGLPAGPDGTAWVKNAVCPHEEAFGDYSPGRYAWKLERVFRYLDPIECRGGRGLWPVPRDCQRAMELQRDPETAHDEADAAMEARAMGELDRKLRVRP